MAQNVVNGTKKPASDLSNLPTLFDSVEPVHGGTENNTVVYVPAGPDCPLNRSYLRNMRPRFESGTRPPDFEWYGLTESAEQGGRFNRSFGPKTRTK